jgi:hypothetical protein
MRRAAMNKARSIVLTAGSLPSIFIDFRISRLPETLTKGLERQLQKCRKIQLVPFWVNARKSVKLKSKVIMLSLRYLAELNILFTIRKTGLPTTQEFLIFLKSNFFSTLI